MVKDAEAHAADDKKRRAVAEARNHAEALIHSTEKNLAEYGAKISPAEKSSIEDAIRDLRAALEGDDAENIQGKTQGLMQAAMKLGEAMYRDQQAPDAEGGAANEGPADNVVDAEFTEVDDEKKRKQG